MGREYGETEEPSEGFEATIFFEGLYMLTFVHCIFVYIPSYFVINENQRTTMGSLCNDFIIQLVGEQIGKLAKAEIKRSKKNPTTKEKWLGKLAIAIQRAVSLASQSLFDDDDDNSPNKKDKVEMEAIEKDIKKLQESINDQIKDINSKANKAGDKYENVKDEINAGTDTRTSKRSNQFEARVTRISDKFTQVANQIDHVGGDLKQRLKTFEQSYNNIESEIRSIPSTKGTRRTIASPKGDSALEKLSQHLSRG